MATKSKAIIRVYAYHCLRCGWIWIPKDRTLDLDKIHKPKTCSRCKSHYWDREKKKEEEE